MPVEYGVKHPAIRPTLGSFVTTGDRCIITIFWLSADRSGGDAYGRAAEHG
jgi:hypothetical protein